MAATEIIQFRVTKEEKQDLINRSRQRGTSLSDTIRRELNLGQKEISPLEAFQLAQARAKEELAASGLPELCDSEIAAYCAEVRRERALEAVRAYA